MLIAFRVQEKRFFEKRRAAPRLGHTLRRNLLPKNRQHLLFTRLRRTASNAQLPENRESIRFYQKTAAIQA
jgi:hypothetical protein